MKFDNILSIILVMALVTISLFAAGCVDNEPTDEETPTATPSPTPTEMPTIEPTVVPTPAGEPESYTVRIDSYLILPAGGRVINVGDTLVFRNFESTRLTRVLVSEDGLWDEDQSLRFMKMINYTFTEPGTYTFHLKGKEFKKWNVTVV